MSGTALFAFKEAATAGIKQAVNDAEIDNVSVTYGFPDREAMPTNAIWFENAESDSWDPLKKNGIRKLDEAVIVTLVIQVLKTKGNTQQEADALVNSLFAVVQQYFAMYPHVPTVATDENPSVASVMWATVVGYKHMGGRLESGGGHGSKLIAEVRFRARH